MARAMLPVLSMLSMLSSCLEEPPYRCLSNEVCFYEGFTGQCDLNTERCVYMSTDCRGNLSITGWVNARGQCVPEPANAISTSSSSSSSTDASPDASTSEGPDPTTGPSTEPTTGSDVGDASTSEDTRGSTTGGDDSTTGTANPCADASATITSQGSVDASTIFDDFDPSLSVDGNLATSWFSTGPEGGGGPSVYTWTVEDELCISEIGVQDNSLNSNPSFSTGYGFDSAVVSVFRDDVSVFEVTVALPGTPDGPFVVDTGGVIGTRVLLELGGHENTSCGGFSELRILGGPS